MPVGEKNSGKTRIGKAAQSATRSETPAANIAVLSKRLSLPDEQQEQSKSRRCRNGLTKDAVDTNTSGMTDSIQDAAHSNVQWIIPVVRRKKRHRKAHSIQTDTMVKRDRHNQHHESPSWSSMSERTSSTVRVPTVAGGDSHRRHGHTDPHPLAKMAPSLPPSFPTLSRVRSPHPSVNTRST